MATTVNSKVEIEVGVTGNQSVKSIKTELREAKEQAIAMARTFGENSVEATNAAKKVAKLKDEIEDLGLKIKGVNPDKFQRIATLVSGLGSGFAAAQGAMALFGSESKDLEKTMVKLQGAIALSQGLQGLKDLKLLFSGINVYALAFAASIGLIIKYWKEFSEAITKVFPSFKVVTEFFDNFKQIAAGSIKAVTTLFSDLGKGLVKLFTGHFGDAIDIFKGIGKDMATAYNEGFAEKDKEIKLEDSIKSRKFQIDLLEAEGKEVLAMRLQLQKDELSLLEKGSDEYNAKLIEIEKTRTAIRVKAETDRLEKIKKANEDWIKAQDAAQKKIIEDGKFNDEQQAQKDKERIELIKQNNDIAIAEEKRLQDEVAALQKKADDEAAAREAFKKQLHTDSIQATYDYLSAIGSLATTFAGADKERQREAFELNQAVAIATAIIKTYEGAATAAATYAAAPYLAAIMAGAQIALGLAQVAQIASQKFPENGQATIPSGSTSLGYSAPNINQSVNQQRAITGNQTGQTGNQTQTNTIKVIVTETDITRVQNRTKDIQRRAIVR